MIYTFLLPFFQIDSYYCAMANGVVYPGHVDVEDFPELLRIVKPGKYYDQHNSKISFCFFTLPCTTLGVPAWMFFSKTYIKRNSQHQFTKLRVGLYVYNSPAI